MSRRSPLLLYLAVSGCFGMIGRVRGEDHCQHSTGTPPPGRPRYIEHTMERAGHPLWLSAQAAPTITPAYVGYYVGGGSAHGGEPRRWEEGTWGWDYEGTHFLRRVPLFWSHGARNQGGTGSYRTDGRHIPDVFNLRLLRREATQ